TDGSMSQSFDSLTLDLEIDNNGYNGVNIPASPPNGLQIAFYKNDFSNRLTVTSKGTTFLGTTDTTNYTQIGTSPDGNLYAGLPNPPGQICSSPTGDPLSGNCDEAPNQPANWKMRFTGVNVAGCPGNNCTGTIIAKINGNGAINECPMHNTAEIYCLSEARLRFYTIDYYVWAK
ncbi:MAG: hypothetical protein NTW59_02445, partial [Candidatus Diapherotrites archaeon]|nr:hypothetical protein [Candidatus Diapherotrites archaeon]